MYNPIHIKYNKNNYYNKIDLKITNIFIKVIKSYIHKKYL